MAAKKLKHQLSIIQTCIDKKAGPIVDNLKALKKRVKGGKTENTLLCDKIGLYDGDIWDELHKAGVCNPPKPDPKSKLGIQTEIKKETANHLKDVMDQIRAFAKELKSGPSTKITDEELATVSEKDLSKASKKELANLDQAIMDEVDSILDNLKTGGTIQKSGTAEKFAARFADFVDLFYYDDSDFMSGGFGDYYYDDGDSDAISAYQGGLDDGYYYALYGDKYNDDMDNSYYDYGYDGGYKASAKLSVYDDDDDDYYDDGAHLGRYYGSKQLRKHRNRYGRRGLVEYMEDGEISGDSNGMDFESSLILSVILFIGLISLLIVVHRYKMRENKVGEKYHQMEVQIINDADSENQV